MSSLTLSRNLAIDASHDRVWSYLTNPALVITCLPGAVLESSSEDGRRHKGNVTVKLGTMSISYRGTAEFIEVDETARKLSVRAKGRERTGAGLASMSMHAEVRAADDARSLVSLEASVDVTGKLVTLGRGMIQIVSEHVLDEFATCLAARVSSDIGPPPAGTDSGGYDERSGEPRTNGRLVEARPVNGLALLWRALRGWLRRLYSQR